MVLTFRNSGSPRDSMRQPHGEPADVDRLAREAAVHAGRGESSRALHCYQLALLIDETRAEIWFNYGMLQLRLGNSRDAVESFEFALRQNPDLFAARYTLAKLLFELGQPLAALSHFREVTLQKPDYLPAWRELANLQWAMGDVTAAEAHVREALQKAPADGDLRSILDGIMKQKGQAVQN